MQTLNRRTLLAAAGLWPCIGRAQGRDAPRRLAHLSLAPLAEVAKPTADVFYGELARLGWERERNLLVEVRYGSVDPSRHEALTRELLAGRPDVFLAGSDLAAQAAAQLAPNLPIAFISGFDPVGNGLVRSLARPGTRATGFAIQGLEVSARRLTLLKEAMPTLAKVAVLVYRDADARLGEGIADLEGAGRRLGVALSTVRVDGPDDLEPAFAGLERQGVRGVMYLYPWTHLFIQSQFPLMARLAIAHRIGFMANFVLAGFSGALLAYGANLLDLNRRAAGLVDRLLKGADPAGIPVEQATVFDFVVDQNTVHALGIEVPRSVLQKATRVIEFANLPRIGFLELGYGGEIHFIVERALQKLGYVNGKNVRFELRYADNKPERLAALADELVGAKVDVIVTPSHVSAFVARKATSRIPIVVRASHGGVETGLFASLARPGANLTGAETLALELDAKRVELLKQIVPGLSRLAVLLNPADPASPLHLKYAVAAAKVIGASVEPLEITRAADIDAALAIAARNLPGALLVFTDEVTDSAHRAWVEFALKHRLPTMCEWRFHAERGCLMSYGPSADEFDAIAARQIDKILKGAKPDDLPVEQVTRYELVINQKVAREIGVTIPRAQLALADVVIE